MSDLRSILQGIYDERGELTPALVVDLARDPSHPLHHRIQWDDAKAADRWRLEQAAALIRSVRVVYVDANDGPKDLRAFSALRGQDASESTYIPTEKALADPFTRTLLLRQMEREWKQFKRRYDHMAEFADLIRSETSKEAS